MAGEIQHNLKVYQEKTRQIAEDANENAFEAKSIVKLCFIILVLAIVGFACLFAKLNKAPELQPLEGGNIENNSDAISCKEDTEILRHPIDSQQTPINTIRLYNLLKQTPVTTQIASVPYYDQKELLNELIDTKRLLKMDTTSHFTNSVAANMKEYIKQIKSINTELRLRYKR